MDWDRICPMKIFSWQNHRYYTNDNGEWNFLPPEHRPGGSRAPHDDWPWPFSKIPRTYTSFIFLDWKCLDRILGGWRTFDWDNRIWPKPWQEQKILLVFKDPFGREYREVYECWRSGDYLYRKGPRLTDDLENGPGYCYVNWVKGFNWLTLGRKKIETA